MVTNVPSCQIVHIHLIEKSDTEMVKKAYHFELSSERVFSRSHLEGNSREVNGSWGESKDKLER